MMELTQERLATILRDNFAGTIKIGGEHDHSIVIELPFGTTMAEYMYNDLINLTNEEGAYKELLQKCRDEEVIKEYERQL